MTEGAAGHGVGVPGKVFAPDFWGEPTLEGVLLGDSNVYGSHEVIRSEIPEPGQVHPPQA
jgi:hypothetical protein